MKTEKAAPGRKWDQRTVQLLLLAALGVLLLIVSSLTAPRPASPPPGAGVPDAVDPGRGLIDYQQQLGRQLESILSLVQGAGRVRVQIALAESPRQRLAINVVSTSSQTQEGGAAGTGRQVHESTQDQRPVIVRGSGGLESPVITGLYAPTITGVLVVAEGAANVRVRADLTRAVSTLLSVPAHRVKVLPGKGW